MVIAVLHIVLIIITAICYVSLLVNIIAKSIGLTIVIRVISFGANSSQVSQNATKITKNVSRWAFVHRVTFLPTIKTSNAIILPNVIIIVSTVFVSVSIASLSVIIMVSIGASLVVPINLLMISVALVA